MRPYTFYLHDGVHPVPGFDFVHCRDDNDAVAHANLLLERFAEYQFIEVYDGQRQRLRIARPMMRPPPGRPALAKAVEPC